MRQMPIHAVKMIGQIGAAFATLFPARTEHEMINNQLAAALEQISQRLFSVWAIKHIFLLDLDYREFAPSGTKRVALARELLFPRQQILPSDQPLTFRYDFCLFVCYFHFSSFNFVCLMFSIGKKKSRHRKRRQAPV